MRVKMRRGFSIFLVLLFGLGPLASALDLSDDAGLPPCCRLHGAHHCAMAMQMAQRMERAQSGSTPTVTTPLTCPYYPGPATLMTGPAPALASTTARLPAPLEHTFAQASGRTEFLSQTTTAHAGRGPPNDNLS
jgi:hypothetical protein